MLVDSSDFIVSTTTSFEQEQQNFWSKETTWCRLERFQMGNRLLLRKSLKPEYLNDDYLRETIRKEYNVGCILSADTDYVVNYYQLVDTPEACYLTMDFIEGDTLAELAVTEPGFLGQSRNLERILLQLLEGLRAIHRCQVVHLDLKPSNIMLTHVSRDVRIIDIGFCYADSYQTTMGMTTAFAAPEQLDGSGDVDARSDIYALGRILQWLELELKDHCQWRKNGVYRKLVSRCLRPQKDERWQSVDEMIEFIRQSRLKRTKILKTLVILALVSILPLTYYAFQQPVRGYDGHTLYGEFSLFNGTCQAVGKITNDTEDTRWQGNLYISSEIRHWGIPFTVSGIADYAFLQDTSFVTVNLPASLTRIGADSFKECTRLIAINIPDNVTEIGSAAFWGDSCVKQLKLPASIKVIPEACFHLCAFSSLAIPEGVTDIDIDAFAVCNNLTDLYLPQSLVRLGRGVFWRCESLEKVSLPAGLASIGEYAFLGCAKLRQVENHASDPQPVMSLFDDSIPDLHLFVPLESVGKYKQSPEWNRLMIEPLPAQ